MITGYGSIDKAVEAVHAGAEDFIEKGQTDLPILRGEPLGRAGRGSDEGGCIPAWVQPGVAPGPGDGAADHARGPER